MKKEMKKGVGAIGLTGGLLFLAHAAQCFRPECVTQRCAGRPHPASVCTPQLRNARQGHQRAYTPVLAMLPAEAFGRLEPRPKSDVVLKMSARDGGGETGLSEETGNEKEELGYGGLPNFVPEQLLSMHEREFRTLAPRLVRLP